MPKKKNKAGQDQNYVPAGNGDASGEYADHETGSNRNFANFKAPLDVEVKDESGEQPTTKTIKSKYNGDGKEVLSKELGKRLKKSKNLGRVLDDVSNADDELSGVIGSFLQENPHIELKVGANLSSKYSYREINGHIISSSISCGVEAIKDNINYAAGGVFFHETGHALDHSYFDSEHEQRGFWSKDFVSKKYGKSLTKMADEEIGSFFKYVDDFEKFKGKVEKEKEDIFNSLFEEKDRNRLKYVLDEVKEINSYIETMPEYKKMDEEYRSNYQKAWQLMKEHASQDEIYKYQDIAEKAKKERNDLSKRIKDERGYYSLAEEEAILSNKRYDAQQKAQGIINVKYGDLSDIFEARRGGFGEITNMGHGLGYWDDENRATELFAEIVSAKSVNPESLNVLKQILPKSLEIFDEIMDEIKGVE